MAAFEVFITNNSEDTSVMSRKVRMLTGFAWIVLAVPSLASAISGPEFACLDCEAEGYQIETPQSGVWYNPQRPGTGIALEVQNGIAAGAYYGFDEDGQSRWWTFAGQLIENRTDGYRLSVTADLISYSGGPCINCAPSVPSEGVDGRRIHLEFSQSSLGTYRIDDGEIQGIVPFSFGVTHASAQFGANLDFSLPDLKGQWLVYVDNVNYPQPFSSSGEQLEFGERLVSPSGGFPVSFISHSLDYNAYPGEAVSVGDLKCVRKVSAGGEPLEPECALDYSTSYPGFVYQNMHFDLSLGNIGHSRIEAYNQEFGIKVLFLRVNYVYFDRY